MDTFFLLATLGSAALFLALRLLWPRSPLAPYVRDCLVVFAAMFVLRCFFFEWFRIPSGSMEPTLRDGDFVVVDKNDYGLTLPFVDGKVSRGRPPRRGEIAVFRYPVDPDVFYIKRVVGLPGDLLSYREDRVYVDGRRLAYAFAPGDADEGEGERDLFAKRTGWEGVDGEGWYPLLLGNRLVQNAHYGVAEHEPACETREFVEHRSELACRVPEGHFFVLGDNRHHSSDSRVWGFVPADNLVGPALRIIFSVSGLGRIGTSLALEESPPAGLAPEPLGGAP